MMWVSRVMVGLAVLCVLSGIWSPSWPQLFLSAVLFLVVAAGCRGIFQRMAGKHK